MVTQSAPPTGWHPSSWRNCAARQMPSYDDPAELASVVQALRSRPPLVLPAESEALRQRLAAVARGEAFLLQGGDCAESLEDTSLGTVRDTFRVMLQMAVVLTYAAACPVIKVGRVAGQFAKPRSSDTETRGDITLPAYRGDLVNGAAFEPAARRPDPQRLLRAYSHSACTLNLLRALAQGGFADLRTVHRWTTDFVRASAQGERFEELADRIDQSLAFMRACGFDAARAPQMHAIEYYTSHEALHLEYEEALLRPVDAGLGCKPGVPMPPVGTEVGAGIEVGAGGGAEVGVGHHAGSAHLLWIGERTRGLDDAHVEFLRGVVNPIGVKLGPGATPDQVLELLNRLDPQRIPGRIVLVCRMGSGSVRRCLPPLLAAVSASGRQPVWCCDPMHGNTVTTTGGVKTRDFDRILDEVRGFFEAHAAAGTHPGGVHVEMTGLDVTECRGGAQALDDAALQTRYQSACDPRLNGSQSLELAFLVADMVRRHPVAAARAGRPAD